ncbi:MAG TPA: FtsX-like permease family protein [Trebonia sp.]|jgi:putative ABC transport system permease protein
MGRVLLVCRLAARDARRRPAAAMLLLIAITAATTTLTLGLALNGTTSQPYQQTRAATEGPDVVADTPGGGPQAVGLTRLAALGRAPGVTAHSGPFPVTFAVLRANGRVGGAKIEGRDPVPAAVDRPRLTQGSWVRPGGIVVEQTFADVLGIRVGDPITLNGQSFVVSGIAVTAADPPYPGLCFLGCDLSAAQLSNVQPGLIWATRPTARNLATTTEPLTYEMYLKLANLATANAFADNYDNATGSISGAPYLVSWQGISAKDGQLVSNEQQILEVGAWLLGLLTVAAVAVLVGGRMAEQHQRVGLLKAVGSTPGLVAAVLLAEHLVVAVIAAAIGLLAGRLAAPLLTSPGAGLLGTVGAPSVTVTTVGLVVGVALAVAVLATAVPAIRAARTSTVAALADAARPPRRRPGVAAVSGRLPVPLLLGLRIAARRPRRTLLSMASIMVTASGIVAVLVVHARFDQTLGAGSGLPNPQDTRLSQVMLILTAALAVLAATNAILITWATVLDTRHPAALTRALGATPGQVGVGLAIAQALPGLAGALLGIPGGIGLVLAVQSAGATLVLPPAWWLAVAMLGTVAAVTAITFIPAQLGAHRPVAAILQTELA